LTGGAVDASGQVSDAILVEAARDGDLEAFEAIVRRHQATIYQVAQRLLDSPADAQDVTQDTFVRAWRGLAGFRGDSTVSTWLYRIVTRRCLDVLATRRPTQELAENMETIADEPPDRVELRERLRAVTRAIATLPAEQRVALTLREFEGLSYQEVADILGVGVPAVKGRIHRARLAVMGQTAAWR
jgi:RNA polymerase sigma-70 factor (ECF subfamily)